MAEAADGAVTAFGATGPRVSAAYSSAAADWSPAIPSSSVQGGAAAANPTRAAPADAAVSLSPAPSVNTWVRTPSGAWSERIRSVAVSRGPSHTPATANAAAAHVTEGANAAPANASPVPANAPQASRPEPRP